jgi:CBS-domain-containing membrane protein
MTRRDDRLDALVRDLGVAYYQALHGDGSAADVSKAVVRVTEATHDSALASPPAAPEVAAAPRRTGRWQVRDVMTTSVVSVSRQASYRHIAQLLHEHHLTALPVLDADGLVTGVVSEADLLRKQERHERTGRRPGWHMHPATRAKAGARTAAELMTSPAVTIAPGAPLGAAARIMSQHHVKRLPVVDADGKLTGIVSRGDLLGVFLRADAEIAAEATAVLTDVLLADPAAVSARAHGGVVTLAGRLASQEQIDAAVRLTEDIDGVVAVTSKLHAPPPENWPGAGYHIPA